MDLVELLNLRTGVLQAASQRMDVQWHVVVLLLLRSSDCVLPAHELLL